MARAPAPAPSATPAQDAQPVRAGTLNEAAELLRREAERVRGMIAAADAMTNAAAVIAQVEEASKTLEFVKKELAIAKGDLQAALKETHDTQEKCAASFEEAQQVIAGEKERAAKIVDEAQSKAHAQAAEIVANTERDAAALLDAARVDAQNVRDDSAKIKAKQAEIEALIEKRKSELADVEGRIAAARETISAFKGT